jgi:hypothetical protein
MILPIPFMNRRKMRITIYHLQITMNNHFLHILYSIYDEIYFDTHAFLDNASQMPTPIPVPPLVTSAKFLTIRDLSYYASVVICLSKYQRSPGPEMSKTFEKAVKSAVRTIALTPLARLRNSKWVIVSISASFQ